MVTLVSESRSMGRPAKNVETASMKLEKDAYELARQAASIDGVSIVVWASRVVRDAARAKILENARRVIQGDSDPPKQ